MEILLEYTHHLQLLTNITYNHTKHYFILIATYSLYTTCNINAVTYTTYNTYYFCHFCLGKTIKYIKSTYINICTVHNINLQYHSLYIYIISLIIS